MKRKANILARPQRGCSDDGARDIQRYLDQRGANAATFMDGDLLLRSDPRKLEVLEEYLHNIQKKIGLTDEMWPSQLERHVKEFMLRHKKLLGLSDADVKWLEDWLKAAKEIGQ